MTMLGSPVGWAPLEEQFHTWHVLLVTPTAGGGNEEHIVQNWTSIDLTETHDGVRSSLEVNALEPTIAYIRDMVTDFLFYRDNVLLYRLRVIDSEDIVTRDAATVKFDCVSYEALLERRILHEDWVLIDEDIDAAWRLIDYTQQKESLGISRGTATAGVSRQRALDAGDDILSAINDFAQADGGFDWWIDQDLVFWAQKPKRGSTLPIEWLAGAEIAELDRVSPIEDYASLVMATGASNETRIPDGSGGETVYPPPPPQIVQLASKPFGLWELTTSDSDVITTASLVEKANWHLSDKGNIRPTYKITVEKGVWHPGVKMGDVFTLRVNHPPRANIRVPVRIEELQISCTADGDETIAMSVRAQEPETFITPSPIGPIPISPVTAPNGRTVQRHRLQPFDDIAVILRSLDKRVERSERTSGGSGTGLTAPAEAGPRSDATAEARFGNVSAAGYYGFIARAPGDNLIISPYNALFQWYQRNAANTGFDWIGGINRDKFQIGDICVGIHPVTGINSIWLASRPAGADYLLGRDGGGNLLLNSYANTQISFRAGNTTWGWFRTDGSHEFQALTRIVSNFVVPANEYYWANFYASATNAGAQARIALSNGGYSPQLRATVSTGERIGVVSNNCAIFVPIAASAFEVNSTITAKRNVRPLRPESERIVVRHEPWSEAVPEPDVMALKPVTFRPKLASTIHVLDPEFPDDPTKGHFEPQTGIFGHETSRERLGLIAEDVQHIIPSAVSHDMDGNCMGIDYAQITVALLDHVQRLTDEVATLRYRIAELEGPRT